MGSESRSGSRPIIAIAVAGSIITGCAASGAGSSPRPSPSLRLVAYDGCGALLSGVRKATAAHVGPYGLGGGPIVRPLADTRVPGDAMASEAPHSSTNVQEPGVDEPDVVKNDGHRIVTATAGRLRVVDVASRRETGTLDLASGPVWSPGELLLNGDRALVIMRPALLYKGDFAPGAPDQRLRVVLVDIAGTPRVVSSMQVDGSYVDARQTGGVARLVVRSVPHIPFPQRHGGTDADATAANRRAVERAPLGSWLPRITVTRDGRTGTQAVPCDRVSHPPSYTGTSLVSVLSIPLSGDMADTAPVSVLAGGEIVYGTGTTLYVTDRRPGLSSTDIYRFDLSGTGPPVFSASGSVPGEVGNRYSMSEYAGNLGVATTSGQNPAATVSTVYVLARHGTRLERIGAVGGLGRGERIYAVRFAGPVGYVATFRQTDPLYTLDLRDPAKPRITGRLKITGYSAYLHPAGDGRLIGVGQQADRNGRPLGAEVSLFDVRDPAAPRKVSGYTLPSAWTTVEGDPHAFLYWPPTGLTVLPLGGPEGALVLRITSSDVHRIGTVTQPKTTAGPVERAILIGNTLWTLSPAGLQANDAASLARTAWVPFA
jgi:uncharacterized secreted protein with C-terminal beta-propeller domain